jgi:glutathione synthase/RimK-type ligase-like ATP-grasp enzyme
MEDVIYALEILGAIVLPGYKFIRAHNNKVFMEMLKTVLKNSNIEHLSFEHFGCYEEFANNSLSRIYPVVIKGAEDAQGRKVRLGRNFSRTSRIVKELSRTKSLFRELWEAGRVIKHKSYIKESKYRRKFILQKYVPDLKNDWKILIFGDRYYILKRGIPQGDFRASGSKYNYGFGSKSEPPDGIFDFAKLIYEQFDVPYISLDIAFDGGTFYLLEFQVVSFGSSTHLKSDCYFVKKDGEWISIFESLELEYLYTDSLSGYISRKGYLNENSLRKEW